MRDAPPRARDGVHREARERRRRPRGQVHRRRGTRADGRHAADHGPLPPQRRERGVHGASPGAVFARNPGRTVRRAVFGKVDAKGLLLRVLSAPEPLHRHDGRAAGQHDREHGGRRHGRRRDAQGRARPREGARPSVRRPGPRRRSGDPDADRPRPAAGARDRAGAGADPRGTRSGGGEGKRRGGARGRGGDPGGGCEGVGRGRGGRRGGRRRRRGGGRRGGRAALPSRPRPLRRRSPVRSATRPARSSETWRAAEGRFELARVVRRR